MRDKHTATAVSPVCVWMRDKHTATAVSPVSTELHVFYDNKLSPKENASHQSQGEPSGAIGERCIIRGCGWWV